jgi:hypothetical protein
MPGGLMNLLFYSGGYKDVEKKAELVGINQEKNAQTCRTIETLLSASEKPIHETDVMILVADKKVLSRLLPVRQLLIHHRIILILSDGDEETLTQAHKLYPRFISYADSDFRDVSVVLTKMRGNQRPMEKQERRE